MTTMTPAEYGAQMGGKRRGVPVKTLKKLLKKAGLKTTGKKAALTRRAKKAKLVKKGGAEDETKVAEDASKKAEEIKDDIKDEIKDESKAVMGGRRRKSRGFKLF